MKFWLAVFLVVLLAVPPGMAFHEAEEREMPRPHAPDGPIVETDIIPANQTQQNALRTVNQALDMGYGTLDEALRPTEELMPEQPVVLYLDGMGDDPHRGALGSWNVMGNEMWSLRNGAAHSGQWGLTSGNQPGGGYLLDAESFLVTPELDLRTGFDLRERSPGSIAFGPIGQLCASVMDQLQDNGKELDDASDLISTACGDTSDTLDGQEQPWMRPWLNTRNTADDPLFVLDFHYRHNLGFYRTSPDDGGRDGVQLLVLEEPPTPERLRACGAGCTVVEPLEGFPNGSVEALGGANGFTGSSDWTRATLDLTDWAEQRVWVAFRAASMREPVPDYFGHPAFFGHDEWFGFQLDDLELRAPAPHVNMQVHELEAYAEEVPRPERPGLDWDQDIRVLSYIRNTGATSFEVEPRVRILDCDSDCDSGDIVAIRALDPVELRPGEAVRIDESFDAIREDASLRAEVSGSRTGLGGSLADADSGDDVQVRDFDVLRIRDIEIVSMEREHSWVEADSPMSITSTVRNLGTAQDDVELIASLFSVRGTGEEVDLPVGTDEQTVTLAAGEKTDVVWPVPTSQPGQYVLAVRTSDQPAFTVDEIADPPEPLDGSIGDRRLSPAFGIDMGPPLLFSVDTRDGCPGDWTRQNDLEIDDDQADVVMGGDNVERWNCAFYEPEGRELFYQGMHPDATCNGEPCLPYSAAGAHFYQDPGDRPPNAVLATPRIEIGDADDPFLLLEHQYSTAVWIEDQEEGGGASQLIIRNIAWVEAQVWNGEEWGDGIFLMPTKGYDTEQSTGIDNPAFGEGRSYNGQHWEACDLGEDPCGWWHPTGHLPGYRSPDEEFPRGEDFRGSAWRVDRIALHASHPRGPTDDGMRDVDLRGETVRFRFHYERGQHDPVRIGDERELGDQFRRPLHTYHDPPLDHGWRIAALAIAEQEKSVRDVALADLLVATEDALGYNAEALGLGPNTTIPIDATVRNEGVVTLDSVTVSMKGLDVGDPGTPVLCEDEVVLPEPLEPEETATVRLECALDASDAGTNVVFEARASVAGGDDLAINDGRSTDALPIRWSPDASVEASVTPVRASEDFGRTVDVLIKNTGNVPLQSVELFREIAKDGELVGSNAEKEWTFAGSIPVGATWSYTDPRLEPEGGALGSSDWLFDPPGTGDYGMLVRVLAPGDIDATHDMTQLRFQAVDNLYANRFNAPATAPVNGIVDGALSFDGHDVWKIVGDDSDKVLRAGDPKTGEMDPGTDAWTMLPPMDLSAVRRASLSLLHNYTFEAGYDGGRLEVSTDGENWSAVTPPPSLAFPAGYPDVTLVGDNPMLEGRPTAPAVAFTGNSAPQERDGRVTTEFDLALAEALQERVALAQFGLGGLEATPSQEIADATGNRFFYGNAWTPPDVEASEGWLLENVTLNEPMPHSGDKMWWSGSPNEFHGEKEDELVETALRLPLPLDTDRGSDEQIVFSYHDWRAGWRDRDLMGEREGTAGRFRIHIENATGDRVEVEDHLVRGDDDGWSRREVDLTAFRGQEIVVEFNYSAVPKPEPSGPEWDAHDIRRQNNEGWFLDDFGLHSHIVREGKRVDAETLELRPLVDNEGLRTEDCSGAGEFEVRISTDLGKDDDEESDACWILVARGAERPGGWQIGETVGPDGLPQRAWRLSSSDAQGYPHLVNSRIITPAVDLSQLVGTNAELAFDHRFHFESEQRGPPPREIEVAIDGGTVEVQVFDAATGRWGPWQQRAAVPLEDQTLVVGINSIGNAEVLEQARYPGVFFKGTQRPTSGATHSFPNGIGSPFQPFDGLCPGCDGRGQPWIDHPVAYAFTGNSEAWRHESWDISDLVGQKVRFAFHAWTNPSDALQEEKDGWTVANVAVEGAMFKGQPVQMRLRAATDGSVLDGEWNIDELEVSGDLYSRNVAVTSSMPREVRMAEADNFTLPLTVSNLGKSLRLGLALGATAIDTDSGEPIPLELDGERLEPVSLDNVGVSGVDHVWAYNASLNAIGSTGDQVEFLLNLTGVGRNTTIFVQILEDQGNEEPFYVQAQDQAAGNTKATWAVHLEDSAMLDIVGATLRQPDPLRVVPRDDGDVVDADSVISNAGTLPLDVEVQWSLLADDEVIDQESAAIHLAAGDRVPVSTTLAVPGPGRYNMQLTASASGIEDQTVALEFPVGVTAIEWIEKFDAPLSEEWELEGTEDTGFRTDRVDGFLSWGMDPGGSAGYCDRLGCGVGEGYEGIAQTPPLDLSDVLNDRAELVLWHAFSFAGGDGGLVEAAILRQTGVDEWEPYTGCEWVALEPTSGYGEETRSYSITNFGTTTNHENLLGDKTPVFGGQQGTPLQPILSRFDLTGVQGCIRKDGQLQDSDLLGHDSTDHRVALRFHVGIQDIAGKPARWGWLIDQAWISSSGVEMGPRGEDDHELPIIRNAPKRFSLDITNTGTTHETYDVSVDNQWVDVETESVSLSPGDQGTVWFAVNVPESANAGKHRLQFEATSQRDPDIGYRLPVILDVEPFPKANLGFQSISTDVGLEGEGVRVEAGTVAPIHILVGNEGTVASKAIDVLFEVEDATGERTLIERLRLDAICPAADEDCTAFASAEWAVPSVGEYTIVVTLDPDRRMLDLDRSDNVGTLDVEVVPLQIPDLVLEDLIVEGVGPDGLVEEGELLVIQAVVRNTGPVHMEGGELHILAGQATLTEAELPLLPPGAAAQVEAVTVASASGDGQIVLSAEAFGDERPDNNDARLVLTVRTHDLTAQSEEESIEARPGDTATVTLSIANDGNGVERLAMNMVGLPPGWNAQVMPDPLVLPPGGSSTAVALINVPENATAGTWHMAVNGSMPAASAEAPFTIEVIRLPGAPGVAWAQEATQTGMQNANISLTSRTNAAERLEIRPAQDQWTFPAQEVDLLPYETRIVGLPLAIPKDTPPGTHEMSMDVSTDAWSQTYTLGTEVLPTVKPNLTWTDHRSEPLPGDGSRSVRLGLSIANDGNVPWTARLSALDIPEGLKVGEIRSQRLAPGETGTVEVPLRIAEGVEAPTGSLRIALQDGSDVLLEEILEFPDLASTPDLRVTDLVVSPRGAVRSGETVELEFRVRNDGAVASQPTQVHVFVDGRLVDALDVPAIAAGEGVGMTWNGTASGTGVHLVSLVADGGLHQLEIHEDNNGVATEFVVEDSSWIADRAAPGAGPAWGLVVLGALLLWRRRT